MNLLPVFLAVADETSFSAAAVRLGVTRSAVSQSVRRLEEQLGAALVTRTTRAASLTEAGERLRATLSRPFAEIDGALEAVAHGGKPSGLLRLAVTSIAERILSGPLIASFAAAYPEITVDITVTDEEFDIVSRGFDAGVRLGEVIEQDMIVVPVGGNVREMAVASPSFIAAYGVPAHPRDLARFRCIGWRPAPEAAPYRWEFYDNGEPFSVQVDPQITTNDPRFMLRCALAGGASRSRPRTRSAPMSSAANWCPCWRTSWSRFPASFCISRPVGIWRPSSGRWSTTCTALGPCCRLIPAANEDRNSNRPAGPRRRCLMAGFNAAPGRDRNGVQT